ncbi:bifunctional UDP-N-acetylglucosamine diphosphorylase/glucosamine-1-phosphate N-acetyltransferase GlmU [Pseudonocardiaceae bacterium YIM PH 21723]|nr:bifunctional UDP-N-acetylglucosamine diphosphorylase/glucosamine-1-phosphate N-acetyltransferase GlmU [Pseudonocardiaceae bacterium YIM PH 21723]
MSAPLTSIVLAAGEGTRMRSATPKVLHQLAGRALVEHAVIAADQLAPDHLVVVTGHGREAVTEYLTGVGKRLERDVLTAVQEQRLGTGHAVQCGLAALPSDISGTVLVTYGDVPLLDGATLREFVDAHSANGNAVTVLTAEVEDPTGYGRIVRDANGGVAEIVEHKDATAERLAIREINSGVYAFDAAVLSGALGRLNSHNAQGELYLTDVLSIARGDGHQVGAVICEDPWLVEGVNDRVQLSVLGAELNRRLVEQWQRAGVTFIDPQSVWLDCDVTLAQDVLVEPGVQLRGTTSVATGAIVGPDTTLTDCVVGEGAHVYRAHGIGAEVGPECEVGPFTYMRPGTKLGRKAKLGGFVETKKADIGAGSKVPHLSYVGDATIGEHTNIGAATVFVNYDGVNKHHTFVGSHARTGADNMFVAPITIGDGAYTAAGSVITQDVPPGAIGVARGAQRNIEGWVARKRPGSAADQAATRALNSSATEED